MKMNKKATHDFNINDLPQNRKEVFFDCLKMRYGIIVSLGLMCVLFALPFVICLLFRDISLSSLLADIANQEYEKEQGYQLFYSLKITYSVVIVPCLVILGIGLSGVMYIIRQLVWYEGLFFFSDFFEGIKKNWKAYTASFFTLGVYYVELTMLSYQQVSELWYGIYLGAGFLLLFPIALFILLMSLIYKFSFRGSVRNAFLLYMRSVPKTLLAELSIVLTFTALGITHVLFKYVALLVMMFFLLPPILMGVSLYGFSLFDEHINKEQYPELVNRGIYVTK